MATLKHNIHRSNCVNHTVGKDNNITNYIKGGNYYSKLESDEKYQPKGDYLTYETDPIWTLEKANYYTKYDIDHKGFVTNVDLSNKVDKVAGYGLSQNDFTNVLKEQYNDAVIKSHTHYNKTILDDITGFKTINGNSIIGDGNIVIKGGGGIDDEQDPIYTADKPYIALKTEIPTKISQLQNDANYINNEIDPTVPNYVKEITQAEIEKWNTENVIALTHAELLQLISNNALSVGSYYRITDYEFTTKTQNTRSAGHNFDIVVQASSNNTLFEDAKAMQHDGDTYFNGQNIESWQLKYDIYNDTNKYTWAVANGKGVIHFMRDDKDNVAYYDFKNLQFAVFKVKSVAKESANDLIGQYCTFSTNEIVTEVYNDYKWFYTLSDLDGNDKSLTNIVSNNNIGIGYTTSQSFNLLYFVVVGDNVIRNNNFQYTYNNFIKTTSICQGNELNRCSNLYVIGNEFSYNRLNDIQIVGLFCKTFFRSNEFSLISRSVFKSEKDNVANNCQSVQSTDIICDDFMYNKLLSVFSTKLTAVSIDYNILQFTNNYTLSSTGNVFYNNIIRLSDSVHNIKAFNNNLFLNGSKFNITSSSIVSNIFQHISNSSLVGTGSSDSCQRNIFQSVMNSTITANKLLNNFARFVYYSNLTGTKFNYCNINVRYITSTVSFDLSNVELNLEYGANTNFVFDENANYRLIGSDLYKDNNINTYKKVNGAWVLVDEHITKSEIPTVPTNVSAFNNDAGYLTQHQDISGLATKAELEGKADKTEIPTNISSFTNDVGYLTQHQSLANYYTKTQCYNKTEIDNTIGNINQLLEEMA